MDTHSKERVVLHGTNCGRSADGDHLSLCVEAALDGVSEQVM